MSVRTQKRLAIAGAVAVALVFLTANARLLAVALQSQPDCAMVANAAPARRAC